MVGAIADAMTLGQIDRKKTKLLWDVKSGDILSWFDFVHSRFSNDAVRASPHPTALLVTQKS